VGNSFERRESKKQERLASLALKRDLSAARCKKCFELFQNASNFSRRRLRLARIHAQLTAPNKLHPRKKQKINVYIHREHTARLQKLHRKRLFGQ